MPFLIFTPNIVRNQSNGLLRIVCQLTFNELQKIKNYLGSPVEGN
jgi:hypothetical protein